MLVTEGGLNIPTLPTLTVDLKRIGEVVFWHDNAGLKPTLASVVHVNLFWKFPGACEASVKLLAAIV